MAPTNGPSVPVITSDELVASAIGLAERAKARFLDGAVSEAKSLLSHAAMIVKDIDQAVLADLEKLGKTMAKYGSGSAATSQD